MLQKVLTHKASPLALTLGSLTTSRNLRRTHYLQAPREYSRIAPVSLSPGRWFYHSRVKLGIHCHIFYYDQGAYRCCIIKL